MIVDKQTVSNDIPSILYVFLVPKESPLYRALQEEREVLKVNYDSGFLSLDGYLGKMGALGSHSLLMKLILVIRGRSLKT